MKYQYKILRKNGADRGRPPVWASTLANAQAYAQRCANEFGCNMIVEMWDPEKEWWTTAKTIHPQAVAA